jgi:hypothetical protein
MIQKITNNALYYLLIILMITFSSCKSDDPTGPAGTEYNGPFGTVTGKFVTPNGDGIPGVLVSINSDYANLTTVISDSDGNFSHTKVPTGSATLNGKKGKFSAIMNAVVIDGGNTTVLPVILQPKNKMAVVLGSFDSIEEIIKDLGYQYDTLSVYDIADPAKLNISSYSALFLNCGSWAVDSVEVNLLKFVRDGGLLYASDWSCDYVELMLPEIISFSKEGEEQEITATVVDPVLKSNLGKEQIQIVYDLGGWAEITDINMTHFKEIVRGSYQGYDGMKENRPLAVYKNEGAGVIVYTSFHNEANATTDMVEILEEFIFF